MVGDLIIGDGILFLFSFSSDNFLMNSLRVKRNEKGRIAEYFCLVF